MQYQSVRRNNISLDDAIEVLEMVYADARGYARQLDSTPTWEQIGDAIEVVMERIEESRSTDTPTRTDVKNTDEIEKFNKLKSTLFERTHQQATILNESRNTASPETVNHFHGQYIALERVIEDAGLFKEYTAFVAAKDTEKLGKPQSPPHAREKSRNDYER